MCNFTVDYSPLKKEGRDFDLGSAPHWDSQKLTFLQGFPGIPFALPGKNTWH
jgi:hypothetical protein